ncbi:MAG TPA: OmpA family protein [Gammaproteobacteria bacterium]|nr:OmpA family protein [Gammaproteobacteria bacterium]
MITGLRSSFLAVSLGSVMLISGCTTNPYTGEQQASKTGMGAGIGAATGALAGQLIGRNTTSTLVGAGIGAVVGGVAGNIMDQQAAELRRQLEGTGVRVVKNGNQIQLVMPSDITFAVNSADIKPQFYSVLNSVSLVLKKYTQTSVQVAGYTDSTGSASHNQQLSQNRAQSVASYLISQGVAAGRFNAVGYGQNNPVASNDTASGRAQNRRVEITLR